MSAEIVHLGASLLASVIANGSSVQLSDGREGWVVGRQFGRGELKGYSVRLTAGRGTISAAPAAVSKLARAPLPPAITTIHPNGAA